MISTLLVENASLVRVLFWVAVAASATIGWLLHRSGKSRILSVLAAIGLLGIIALTVSPSDGGDSGFCTVQFSVPSRGIDTLANVAMMVPLSLFGALWLRRPLAVLAAVSGLSAGIELLQALLPALGRACDTDDWLMNTVGAVVGVLLAIGIIAVDGGHPRRHAAAERRTSR
ncbi:VanZ like protein [Glaciihabitans tibetensis]|uniref:VanZ like protein n=1 Tax=Glaciihabitans tibetensis TaxID=1266600 RepID=A0A2T0V6W4_9MICO|nr:VanZ family protein [Glaciihabitans tibetensis]PRY65916.1 VanZ like protein [Glaciihabitans tibetensis]